MKKSRSLALIFSILSMASFAQTNNTELQKMYDEDQRSRSGSNINWMVLSKQDSLRELRVYELIKEGKVVTAMDYYNTAMIFQHGRDTIASHMAVTQMKKAIERDSTINRWLLAAAIDRDLMRRNKPQIYGTQYVKRSMASKWERYTIDSTKLTDKDRRYYGVETLAEQKIKERTLNLVQISVYHEKSKTLGETIAFIKAEIKKGSKSDYDVSENGINTFGYDLLSRGKDQDALKIFELNTQLFPNGYNTFDSYGECLMKLGKKSEALKAYKKSLELNPKNDNARRILAENK